MRKISTLLAAGCTMVLAGSSYGAIINFDANLDGLQEVPPHATPAFGFGTVSLDSATNKITVDESWQDLLGTATASHIHGPAMIGTSAPVLFPFTGVPAGSTGAIPEQTFQLTPTQVTQLESGLFYFNVHSTVFPGGEVRGQIVAVPEPMSAAALAILGAGLLGRRARRT